MIAKISKIRKTVKSHIFSAAGLSTFLNGSENKRKGEKLPSPPLILLLQQPDASLLAFFHSVGIPDAGLNLTDVAAAHHQHTQAALADTAADG